MSDTGKIFAGRLRRVRGDRTQVEFAVFLGVPQQTYSRYERGQIPPWETLEKIARKIGIPAQSLISESPKNPKEELSKICEVAGEIADLTPGDAEKKQTVFNEAVLCKIEDLQRQLEELKRMLANVRPSSEKEQWEAEASELLAAAERAYDEQHREASSGKPPKRRPYKRTSPRTTLPSSSEAHKPQ